MGDGTLVKHVEHLGVQAHLARDINAGKQIGSEQAVGAAEAVVHPGTAARHVYASVARVAEGRVDLPAVSGNHAHLQRAGVLGRVVQHVALAHAGGIVGIARVFAVGVGIGQAGGKGQLARTEQIGKRTQFQPVDFLGAVLHGSGNHPAGAWVGNQAIALGVVVIAVERDGVHAHAALPPAPPRTVTNEGKARQFYDSGGRTCPPSCVIDS